MDEREINKVIGFAVIAILAYYVLQLVVPFLIYGVVGLVIWRIYQEFQKDR